MRNAIAFDSGMECATGTYSMSKGPSCRRLPGAISRRSIFGAPGSESFFVSMSEAVKRVA